MSHLGLHNLKAAQGAKRSKIRVGRGNASKGTTAGRGTKGQRARTGGRNKLTLKGVKTYLLRIPKSRGFKSMQVKPAIVTLWALDKSFKTGERVDAKTLLKRGLIKSAVWGVKIIGGGKFDKKLVVQARAFTAGAKEAIIKAGGRVEVIK